MRYNFICQYCGYDGRSFPNWFQLTVDHIIPQNSGGDNNPENLITACQACNSITSRMKFDKDVTREEVLAAKRKRVRERQKDYFQFWKENVAPRFIEKWKESDSSLSKIE